MGPGLRGRYLSSFEVSDVNFKLDKGEILPAQCDLVEARPLYRGYEKGTGSSG